MVRTTTVGSWPIPFGLKRYLTSYYKGELSDEAASAWLGKAARIAMDEMIGCGLDQFVGGEVFAPDFVHHLPPRLAGLEMVRPRNHRAGYAGVGIYRIVGDISAPRGLGNAKAFRREHAIEPALDKAAVPSPWTVAELFESDARLPQQMENVARMVELEVRDMVHAGAGEVQLDAPNEAIAMIEARRAVSEIARWLAYPFRAVRDVRRTVHFCLGDNGRKPATQEQSLQTLIPLIQALEGQIDRVHLECSHSGQWEERSCLREIPESIEIIAGIPDVKSRPESADLLRAKITALLELIPAERLLVSSSCGCGRVPHDEAIELMRNLVAAAA